jgi:hypothetical protein
MPKEKNMSEERQPEDNLGDEFRTLGNNLLGALRSMWDSPERKRLTEELETNLNEFSATVRKEVESFNESPTGQRLKEDVDTIGGKVRSEINDIRVKDDLLSALRSANNELAKIIQRWTSSSSDETQQSPPENVDSEGSAPQDEA